MLEIGTGSGYQTAILGLLAKRVYSLERVPELAHQAIQRMREMGLDNVKIQVFDGTVGWSEVAPFDRILVTAGAPKVPSRSWASSRRAAPSFSPRGRAVSSGWCSTGSRPRGSCGGGRGRRSPSCPS